MLLDFVFPFSTRIDVSYTCSLVIIHLCSLLVWVSREEVTGLVDFSLVKDGNPFYPLVLQDAHEQDVLPPVIRPNARSLSSFNHESPKCSNRQ